MDKFWRDFKTLFNYRVSWYIQNIFINAFKKGVNEYEKEKTKTLFLKHKKDLKEKQTNNPFHKKRNKIK